MSVAREQLNLIDGIIAETLLKQEELRALESLLDRKVSDLYHVLEFSNFNAYEGYLIAKRMQDALKERREVKNDLTTLEKVTEVFTEKKLKEAENQIKARENNIKTQIYSCRVLTESTDGDILKIVKRNDERVRAR